MSRSRRSAGREGGRGRGGDVIAHLISTPVDVSLDVEECQARKRLKRDTEKIVNDTYL